MSRCGCVYVCDREIWEPDRVIACCPRWWLVCCCSGKLITQGYATLPQVSVEFDVSTLINSNHYICPPAYYTQRVIYQKASSPFSQQLMLCLTMGLQCVSTNHQNSKSPSWLSSLPHLPTQERALVQGNPPPPSRPDPWPLMDGVGGEDWEG